MIFPIRTSIRPWRTPYVNYALIIINVIIFLLTYSPHYRPFTRILEPLRPWAENFMLHPRNAHIWQFVTYAFLHGGFMHVIGNMYFLYLFGNNINDKLGSVRYLLFYLAGAVFSAAGHIALGTLFSPDTVGIPMLGASGAVAAVTGAYLVLYPRTLITIIYWFIIIGTMEVPALFFIAFKMILIDNVIVANTPNVAHNAHLAGYFFGISALLVILATGRLSSTKFDLWTMLKQWNRRRQYRDVVSGSYNPFTGTTAKRIKKQELKKTPAQQQKAERIKQLRNEIAQRITQRNLPTAALQYLELLNIDSRQILPRQYLLDIANQFAGESKYSEAAQTYEKFLTHYGNYEYAEQVKLMLGIIYSRYLHNQELAVKHLQTAETKLSDPDQLKMCKDELRKLQS